MVSLPKQAVTDGMLWAMDRGTFRTIVLASRVQQRARFEKVEMPCGIHKPSTLAKRARVDASIRPPMQPQLAAPSSPACPHGLHVRTRVQPRQLCKMWRMSWRACGGQAAAEPADDLSHESR